MKNLSAIFTVLVLLGTANHAFADERAFRINRNSVTQDGYAIAWGLKNQKVDFEKVEQSQEETDKLLSDYTQLQNYIVDVQTDSILDTFSGEDSELIGDIRDQRLGNHFHMNLFSISDVVMGDQDILLVLEGGKWNEDISTVYALKREYGKVNVVSRNQQLGALIDTQIMAKLSKADAARYQNGANYMEVSKLDTQKGFRLKMVNHKYTPKADNDQNAIAVTAIIRLELKDGQVSAVVEAVKAKKE